MSEIPKVQIRKFSRGKFGGEGEAAAAAAVMEREPSTAIEEDDDLPMIDEDDDDDFLADLKAPVEKEPPTPANTPEPPPPPPKKLYESGRPFTDKHLLNGIFDAPAPASKPKRGGSKKSPTGFGDIFGSSPTPLLGADRRELLTRIREYKTMFSDIAEVKNFKVKPNATEQELNNAIAELETIVNCGSVQQLTDQMVLAAIRVVEGVSSRTERFDITSTADMLEGNPEFHRLSKQLAIKYRVYNAVPVEYQMMLLILSTSMVARQKNMRSAEVASMLNRPMS